MNYTASVAFDGRGDDALELARTVLATNGFEVNARGLSQLSAKGPGMFSTMDNPLLGATAVTIRIAEGRIDLAAELGGVRRMRTFLYVFPPALGLVLIVLFLTLGMEWRPVLLTVAVAICPWIVLSPVLARWVSSRTLRAIDTLLHNMTAGKTTSQTR
jgi:hypothetical protein